MSVSPRQNFWKPPPVPEMPTVTRTPGLAFWNSSATASLIGKTVLEPSRVTVAGGAAPPPAPVRAGRRRSRRASSRGHHRHCLTVVGLSACGSAYRATRFRGSFRRVNSALTAAAAAGAPGRLPSAAAGRRRRGPPARRPRRSALCRRTVRSSARSSGASWRCAAHTSSSASPRPSSSTSTVSARGVHVEPPDHRRGGCGRAIRPGAGWRRAAHGAAQRPGRSL